ncbi:MAG: GNAT family N-acetyltransferase [Robiginitomaculum sp.]|nr:GNAT family N-acetyltransferase [Robiginitomaculum sp.]
MSEVKIQVLRSIAEISAGDWNALANPDISKFDPFISHQFLRALEQSGSVGKNSGWLPCHIIAENDRGEVIGAMPLYLKNHSQGEYVFDHSWAAAYENAGGQYYPKLQSCIPFTPVTGARILATEPKVRQQLVAAMQEVTGRFGASSAHVTFTNSQDANEFTDAGWLKRNDLQFHFTNQSYENYDDFLARLTSRKRKAIRKERKKANQNVQIIALSGDDLASEHWDSFYEFYLDTGARKWGQPYLNRQFFDLLHQSMSKHILLIMAKNQDKWVAGALNFIGGDCLYGRYWGCVSNYDSLHFELCYHRAIEAAIELGLSRVEAGAQGSHKIARGYLPVQTCSYHFIPDPGFASAVQNFLAEERAAIKQQQLQYLNISPYRQSAT